MVTPETQSQRPQALKTIGEEATKLSSSPIRQLCNSLQKALSAHINVILANPEVFFAGLERQSSQPNAWQVLYQRVVFPNPFLNFILK